MCVPVWRARLPRATVVRHARKPAVNRQHKALVRTEHTPYPKSQFLSQSCESVLPTSLTHILPSTRGCAPWRPAAVMGTTSRESNMLTQIFKGCSARAKHGTKVRALPAMAAISPRNAIPWRATMPACAHANTAKWLSRKGEISSRGALQRL